MTIQGTIAKLKRFGNKLKSIADAVDGFLSAFKFLGRVISLIGVIYTVYSTKLVFDKNTEIQHKTDTLKMKEVTIKVKMDSIKVAKAVCAKVIDDDPDTAKKYKKLAKVFYMKPIEVKGEKYMADSNSQHLLNILKK